MTVFALLGALETGLLFGLVALGVHLSFRVLNFPDLTVDGSFPLGAAVAGIMIASGIDPWLATGAAIMAGMIAGMLTAWLTVRLGILHLLSGILVMIALFSINLRIMGRPNIALIGETTVFTPFDGMAPSHLYPLAFLVTTGVVMLLLGHFLTSRLGLAMRAAGNNPRMAGANGIDTGWMTILGLGVSNGLVGLAGALFAQSQGAADVAMGIGTIVIGLASVIIGETLAPGRGVIFTVVAVVIGSILYRLSIAVALNAEFLGLQAQDLNLITAVLVGVALVLPRLRRRLAPRRGRVRSPVTRTVQ